VENGKVELIEVESEMMVSRGEGWGRWKDFLIKEYKIFIDKTDRS
jgi:hypothetical protein